MKIAKYIICRACSLPKDAQLQTHWESLKALIAIASPVLFEQIDDINPSMFEKLDHRTKISVARYFNRARFRPVPYGAFSTVGLLKAEAHPQGEAILSKRKVLLNWRDWTAVKSLANAAPTWADDMMWRTQATLYTDKDTHYFFQSTEGQTELFSLKCFEELDRLLDFCRLPRSIGEIKGFAAHDWGFFRDMMAQLLALQVLVHHQLPNITGEDYFERMGLREAKGQSHAYSIYIRHADKGFRNIKLESELERYVAFAQTYLPNPTLSNLSDFKQQLIKRYEYQWQPLAKVLDPNEGLGYAGLSNAGNAEDIAALLPKPVDNAPSLLWDELSKFLLKSMVIGKAIDLMDFKEKKTERVALPNTLSALLQPAGNGEWAVEHLGGPSATQLLGRFAKEGVLNSFAQELANLERDANPDVKFFDVAYQTGERTDNINRRPQLYELELALGGWSTHPQQLQLSDLFINVVDGELVLYSAAQRCRVIPRMASAYNTLRSSHPLLRLLADLQYQSLQHQFLPDLEQHFPGMDHYPALKFGQLLLRPAKWKVPQWARNSQTALDRWTSETVSSQFVKVGRADQYLCLDLTIAIDRELLWDSLQRDAGLTYVSDWPAGPQPGMLAADGNRSSYQLHYVLSHQAQIYAPVNTFQKPAYGMPWALGSPWFFTSLYVLPENQPMVLRELIRPLLSKYEKAIADWFYVLYGDPQKHIRLRIKWHSRVTDELRWALASEIGSWLGRCGISHTVIQPYEPEWQRYGLETMALTERFFGLDSAQALLVMDREEEERLSACYGWIWGIVTHALKQTLQQKLFLERMAARFANEMGWERFEFKTLNQSWRNLSMPAALAFPTAATLEVWENICAQTSPENHEQRLADFIHMHVNRRFPVHARVREAQLYQYLLLHLKKVSKLAEQVPVTAR